MLSGAVSKGFPQSTVELRARLPEVVDCNGIDNMNLKVMHYLAKTSAALRTHPHEVTLRYRRYFMPFEANDRRIAMSFGDAKHLPTMRNLSSNFPHLEALACHDSTHTFTPS